MKTPYLFILVGGLVHAVQLKPTIKVQISGRMASIGINHVVTASVYSENTRMKKLMNENDNYYYYYRKTIYYNISAEQAAKTRMV